MNKFLIFPLLLLAPFLFGQSIEHYEKLALASFYAKDFPTLIFNNEKIIELERGNTSSRFLETESAHEMENLFKLETQPERISNYPLGLATHGLNERDEAKNKYEKYLNKHDDENGLNANMAPGALRSIAAGNNWIEKDSYLTVLPIGINSERANMAPLRYANKLYFSTVLEENYLPTKNKKKSKSMVKHPVSRIYEVQFNKEPKESSVNPRSSILNASNVALMPDASRMYYTLCTDENPDSQEHCTIWFRNRFYDGTWGPAIRLPEKINYRNYTATQPTVGYDWMLKKYVLYYVSDRPGGIGGKDIWCATIEKDDTFGEPFPIPINTSSDDVTPFFHQLSQTLFFSSKGWQGYGGYDIFRAEKTDANDWGMPQNMGPYLNTAHDELYYTYHSSSKFAYFVGGQFGKNKIETNVFEAHVFVDFQMKVFDETRKATVKGVEIEIEDLNTGIKGVFHTAMGSNMSKIKLEPGTGYRVKVTSLGYHPFTFNLDTNKISYFKTIEENVFLKPIARP